jgi:hypothetical protein
MKSFIITLLFWLAISSYSQDKQTKQDEEGLMKVEDLPAVVIKRIGADFSVYIPDNHPDKDVRRVRKICLRYWYYKGAESYLLMHKNSSLSRHIMVREINSRRTLTQHLP